MITYAERACFTPEQIALLARAQEAIARISNAWDKELRCHELARAVQRVCARDLVVVDGKCGPIEHSWLVWPDDYVILDPYVPGRLPAVQLVDPIVGMAYRPGGQRSDIRQQIVARLVLEMCYLSVQHSGSNSLAYR